MYTHPFFEATPSGAAPGPPVKTGAVFVSSGVVINRLHMFRKAATLAPGGGGCAKILKRTPPTIDNGDMALGARIALNTCARD